MRYAVGMKSVNEKSAAAAAPRGRASEGARKRLRRSSSGGYARGDETRQRIIEVATRLFGERGFEGASTRDIATAAGVNAPALQYYFNNKEGVYVACVEHIIDEMRAMFDPVIRQANAAIRADAPTEVLIDAFLQIYSVILDCVPVQPHATHRRLFLARELKGEEPTVASKLLQTKLRQPFSKVCYELLARIAGVSASDPVVRIRMLGLKGQVLPLHQSECHVLESLGWTKLDAAKIALIKATLLDQTRRLLESWAARNPPSR